MLTSMAFLGPAGTYGEQACRRLAALCGSPEAERCPQATIRAVVMALQEQRVDAAVVPVENSVEGGVTSCSDLLWQSGLQGDGALAIEHALILPIRHALLADGSLEQITEVLSHPQALAQCSGWLQQHLPQALQLPTSSTAEAARLVRGSRFRAAVASRQAGQEQGVAELAYPINDQPGNCTRFLLLRQPHQPGLFAACQRPRRVAAGPGDLCGPRFEHEPDRITPLQTGTGGVRVLCRSRGGRCACG